MASEGYIKHSPVKKLKWNVGVREHEVKAEVEEAVLAQVGARAGMPEESPDGKSGWKWSFGETESYNSNFSLSSEPFSCCYFSFKTNQRTS